MTKLKAKKTNIYFGKPVEDAIQAYNLETRKFKKDQIFVEQIYPALNKLVENVINTWKFWRYETTYVDLKSDIVAFLSERLHLIKPGKGKAYSFFTICAKHYCIKKNQDLHKETIRSGDLIEVDSERNIHAELDLESYQEVLKDFIAIWSAWCYENLEKLYKSKNERKVADAFITLFQNIGDLELYNKKELYILIREHSKLDTQYITKVAKSLKVLFYKMFSEYRSTGKIDTTLYL